MYNKQTMLQLKESSFQFLEWVRNVQEESGEEDEEEKEDKNNLPQKENEVNEQEMAI